MPKALGLFLTGKETIEYNTLNTIFSPKEARRMNSAEKTVCLLKILAQKPYVYGVTELSAKIGCGKSGTFKLLSVLVKEGLAAQTPNHKYTLGIAAYLLGKTYEDEVGVAKFAKPYLARLRDLSGENAALGMMVNEHPTIIYREESRQMVRVSSIVGTRRPFYAGAVGKTLGAYEDEAVLRRHLVEEPLERFTAHTLTSPAAILADLAQIRRQGYAVSDGELSDDIIGFGAPVRDASGHVWAAVCIDAPKMRVDALKRERCIFLVQEFARQMSEDSGAAFEQADRPAPQTLV